MSMDRLGLNPTAFYVRLQEQPSVDGCANLFKDAIAFKRDHFLREVAYSYTFGNTDFSAVDRFLSENHSEESGLAGAVGTDKTDSIPCPDLKRTVLEDNFISELFVKMA